MEKFSQENCLILLRLSSPKQAQQGESFADQLNICSNLAKNRNLNVLNVYSEQFSGRKEVRPVIEDIVSYIKENPGTVKYLIFRAIDRFTRNGTLGYELLKNRLAQYGVELIDSNGIIQPSKNTLEHLGVQYDWSITRPSEITEMIMAQQGKNEVNQILTRMIGAEINLVREGYKVRQADDGYVNEKVFIDGKKKVIQKPDPLRAPFFIKMFEMRASGAYTDKEIVDYVNAMGYRSKKQSKWNRSKEKIVGKSGQILLTVKQLQKIIQRPIYCGINNEKWLEAPIKTVYKGLITVNTFNSANKGALFIEEKADGSISILKDYNPRQLKRMKDNPLFPFGKVILCPKCQKPLIGSASKGKSGKSFPAYHCARNHPRFSVSKGELEQKLSAYVEGLKRKDGGFMKAFEATLINKYREKEKELGDFSAKVGATVIEIESEKKSKIEAYTSTTNEVIRAELEKQINDLHKQLETTREQRNGVEVKENDVHAFVAHVKTLMEHPEEMLIKQKNLTLMKSLFGLVFDELPTYEEIVSGTPKLSLPYMLKSEFETSKSLSVSSPFLEWNTIENMIIRWNRVFKGLEIVI